MELLDLQFILHKERTVSGQSQNLIKSHTAVMHTSELDVFMAKFD